MKEIENLSRDEALALCTRTEGDLFDRKSKNLNGQKAEKIAVALANADGGEFVLGIADDSDESEPEKRWDGRASVEEYNDILQCLFSLSPTVSFRYSFQTCDDFPGTVLRVFIDRSENVCKASSGKVFQRVGAQSLTVTDPEKITALSFAKGATSFEEQSLPNLDPEIITDSKECERFISESLPKSDSLTYCVNEGLINEKDFVPICAGLLLFSDNPQAKFTRRCGTKIVFYDTKQDIPDREHLKLTKTVEGPLYQQIHESVGNVEEIISRMSIMTPDGLKKVRYPPEAIWEIVVNALIHRDYSIADDVQITIFQNRIEVKSPGKLPGFVTEENFLDVRYSRNPKIVRSLARYKEPPNKDLGEGLDTAFEMMKSFKLNSPVLKEVQNYVVVIIPHTPLATPEELVIQYLDGHSEIRNRVARELTGIKSENQMKEVFYRLRDQGLIKRVVGKRGNAAAWTKT